LARSSEVTVIAPERSLPLKELLLQSVLPDQLSPVWGFFNFISWRTTWAAADKKWPRKRAVLEMLSAYNSRTLDARRGRSLLVDIPQDAEKQDIW
jgi:hypothetical protein